MKNERRGQGGFNRYIPAAAVLAVLLVSGCGGDKGATGDAMPTGGNPGVLGFVLSNVYIAAFTDEAQACPQLADGVLEHFMNSMSVAERKKYGNDTEAVRRLMNERWGFKFAEVSADPKFGITPELVEKKHRELGIPAGKGGLVFLGKYLAYDGCTDPGDFPEFEKGYVAYAGKQAHGIDLDGRADAEDFVGPDGEAGVDNQLWRAFGCVRFFREVGVPDVAREALYSARAPMLVEITGVDDERNDPEVEVGVYASNSAIPLNPAGKPLPRASFDVDSDPQLQARTRGRIVDGVVTTEPFDVKVVVKEQIIDTVRDVRSVRLRATLKPDGSIEGGLYGYHTVDSAWSTIQQMSQRGASFTGISCPWARTALQRYADALPDPQTGRNTAISSAFGFAGVRAHIIHRPGHAGSSAPASGGT